LVDEDVFNGERGNFSKENATEGVCNAGVNANEGKDSIVRFVLVELDVEVLGGASAGTLMQLEYSDERTLRNSSRFQDWSSPG